MVTLNASRLRAVAAVKALVDQRWPTLGAFAEASGVEVKGLGQFLNGQRWPRLENRTKIEDALGWEHGTLDGIANGGTAPAGNYTARMAAIPDLPDRDAWIAAIDEVQADIHVLNTKLDALRKGLNSQ